MGRDTWRLIVTRGLDGALNMAIDHVLAVFADAVSLPVLRLYDWNPPAISLGYHQREDDIDLDAARQSGYDVVRRPTGGRAILHHEELTYSVVIPSAHWRYSRSTGAVYSLISGCFIRGLSLLGLPVEIEAAERGENRPARTRAGIFCFAASARHELKVGGRKILGSAQRRYANSVLQHGSLLLGPAHLRLVDYVRTGSNEKAWLARFVAAKTISLSELAGHPYAFEDVVQAVQQGFAEELDIDFEPDNLTENELNRARELRGRFLIAGREWPCEER